MKKIRMELKDLKLDAFDLTQRCILVTAGTYKDKKYNTMTVNWGFFGTMWYDPSVLLVIRPSRYTYDFLKKQNDFTLTILPEEYKYVYAIMGSKSGRDSNKMQESRLTAIESDMVESPSFQEACLTLECKVKYIGDLQPEGILDKEIVKRDYPDGNYHKMIIGSIVSAWRTDKF